MVEEPSGLQSIGSQRVRHDWTDWAHTHAFIKVTSGSLFDHFIMREHTRRWTSMNLEVSIHQTLNLPVPWSRTSQPPELQKINFCCSQATQSMALSCSCAQSRLTLCDPMDHSPPGSSVCGNSQARILEWIAISFSRGFPCRPAAKMLCFQWVPGDAVSIPSWGTKIPHAVMQPKDKK